MLPKINKNGPIHPVHGQCWLWVGAVSRSNGRGMFDNRAAYRAMYEVFVGEIPAGKWVLHKCDNPTCVNPSHLFLGVAADNSKDMRDKGRQHKPKGSLNNNSKLTEQGVLWARDYYSKNQSSEGVRYIAKVLGVSTTHTYDVLSRRCWTHI